MAQVYQSPSVEEIKAALTSEFPQVEIISTEERRVKAKCPGRFPTMCASSSTIT